MSVSAALYGLQGPELLPGEKAFFRDADPWGIILFGRNVDRPKQLARLCASLRDGLGRDLPIFIDQEGGRVQRLKAPTWRAAPPAARFGELWDRDPELAIEAVRLNHILLAAELKDAGIDVDFAPCCDLQIEGADAVIGDRAFHADPDPVSALATAALDGLRDQGVAGVIKHIPGHGRADADSHFKLPVVRTPANELRETDLAAFKGVSGATMAMTAHVVFTAFDAELCATLSRTVIADIIRGEIGFDGLLMSDDLSMQALDGSLRQRGEGAAKAGCEILMHCNGDMKEMVEIAHAAPRLDGQAKERAIAAEAERGPRATHDTRELATRLEGCFRDAGLEPPAP
jgi:beta-N-acetylhexosaminidase